MTPSSRSSSWILLLVAVAIVTQSVTSFAPPRSAIGVPHERDNALLFSSSTTGTTSPTTQQSSNDSSPPSISSATHTLQSYDKSQQQFIASDGSQGMGGGLSALHHIQSLSPSTRTSLQSAIVTLVTQAHKERSTDSSKGRIMLGFCSANAPEALSGLKSWVTSLALPRGMLHGMDVDGVPIPVEDLGAVYVKYSTGGAMTFGEMRRSGRGFDALWRPGDALLEMYDGDFRGVYLNVELGDGEFRQFGVLPTDLFMEEEEDW
ncbi:predicted protein [Thalassiosira pseudonana CCMP1335]|uniref:Uncharacterized protein n=1 Tax=Thalassiosira pseudonana TaxID=35128 RepID=B8CGK3_THAPS|nr:predicted protein [Thalassiosira pseudonana CCMP1335]EED87341.1 predicted protein [Thalassiosira pseudonana CCMP1335]